MPRPLHTGVAVAMVPLGGGGVDDDSTEAAGLLARESGGDDARAPASSPWGEDGDQQADAAGSDGDQSDLGNDRGGDDADEGNGRDDDNDDDEDDGDEDKGDLGRRGGFGAWILGGRARQPDRGYQTLAMRRRIATPRAGPIAPVSSGWTELGVLKSSRARVDSRIPDSDVGGGGGGGGGDHKAVHGKGLGEPRASLHTPSGLSARGSAGMLGRGSLARLVRDAAAAAHVRRGLLYMLLSTVVFCGMGMCVKAIALGSEPLPTLEVVFLRGLFGVLGFAALVLGYWTLTTLSVADSTVLGFLAPTFTGILGRIFLNEPWEVIDAAAGIVSLGGVLLIARPEFLFGSGPGSTHDTIGSPDEMGMFAHTPTSGPLLPARRHWADAAFTLVTLYRREMPQDGRDTIAAAIRAASASSSVLLGNVSAAAPDSIGLNRGSAVDVQRLAGCADPGGLAGLGCRTVRAAVTAAAAENVPSRVAGVLAGLLGALFVGAAVTTVRMLSSRGAQGLHTINWFHLTSVPLAAALGPLLPASVEPHPWIVPAQASTWLLAVMVAALGFSGQLLMGRGLALESAAKASAMTYFQAAVAFVAEWVVWGVTPHWMSLVGGLIVVACVAAVALVRRRQQ
ncbi:hypothetical protein HK105_208188 [Polyrhizophydium stewartii]|uniref:EamA domain-containing protein n=1 Tax=Polyrhizophydium stewartii TaxID=2732419 RepID=A0ABR4MYI9_9FUNG